MFGAVDTLCRGLGDPDRAHHEGGDVIAHALLPPTGLLSGGLFRGLLRRGLFRGLLRRRLRLFLVRGGGGVAMRGFALGRLPMLGAVAVVPIPLFPVRGVRRGVTLRVRRVMFGRVARLGA